MTISKFPLRCKLELERKIIEQVMVIKYLGVEITSWGSLQNEVVHQANKAARIAGCMNDIIWKNKFLNKEAKTRIYKSVVRPILTYAVETRSDTSKTKRVLETNEMSILRKIVHKSRRDKIRNEDIRKELNVQAINDWVDRRRFEWNQHISRMTSNRIVRVARDNLPVDGRRSPGRPKKRWKDS